MKMVIATSNEGKIREFNELFQALSVTCIPLSDFEKIQEVEETGTTFQENAILKAQGYAKQTGLLTLAEDSGLCCDALDGAPGVYSARFSGKGDQENNKKLLAVMSGVPVNCRGAQYESHIAIATPNEVVGTVKGIVRGTIHTEEIGDGGFGYDPLFFYPDFQKTFGQVPAEMKNGISHRFHSCMKAKELLENYLLKINS